MIRRWWRNRRLVAECETCGRTVPRRKAVVLTETFPEEWGGSAIAATFCRSHDPR